MGSSSGPTGPGLRGFLCRDTFRNGDHDAPRGDGIADLIAVAFDGPQQDAAGAAARGRETNLAESIRALVGGECMRDLLGQERTLRLDRAYKDEAMKYGHQEAKPEPPKPSPDKK